MTSPDPRLDRARIALEGLSVGDAFGERFFYHPDLVGSLLDQRALPAPPWAYTDDTEMALSLVDVLRRHGQVDQDTLAQSFAGIVALRTRVDGIPAAWRVACEPPPL